MSKGDDTRVKRLLVRLGLAFSADGKSRSGKRRSRYGMYVSARLDEDIDELRERLARLERGDAARD